MASNGSFSRRGFMGAGAALAATTALGGARNAAARSTEPALPPAIAALPVLSGLARPFTNAERLARIERAKQLMAAAKIDAIVLANDTVSSQGLSSSARHLKRAARGSGSTPVPSARTPRSSPGKRTRAPLPRSAKASRTAASPLAAWALTRT